MKVKVGHLTYKVLPYDPEEADAANADGRCFYNSQVLKVDLRITPERQAETLIHELMHACYSVFHLPTEADEETTVTATASALATLFHDNPGLLPVMANGLAGVALNLERA